MLEDRRGATKLAKQAKSFVKGKSALYVLLCCFWGQKHFFDFLRERCAKSANTGCAGVVPGEFKHETRDVSRQRPET